VISQLNSDIYEELCLEYNSRGSIRAIRIADGCCRSIRWAVGFRLFVEFLLHLPYLQR